MTVTGCCAHRGREPSGQRTVLRVGFQFLCGHLLEETVQVHMLGPIDPLTGCSDLRVGLNGRHHCRSRNVNLAGSFDDLFQGRPDIALALREKPESVGVAIDTGAVCQPRIPGQWLLGFSTRRTRPRSLPVSGGNIPSSFAYADLNLVFAHAASCCRSYPGARFC